MSNKMGKWDGAGEVDFAGMTPTGTHEPEQEAPQSATVPRDLYDRLRKVAGDAYLGCNHVIGDGDVPVPCRACWIRDKLAALDAEVNNAK